MSRFKVGDKVVAVIVEAPFEWELTCGKTYTVSSFDGESVYLEEDSRGGFYCYRFMLERDFLEMCLKKVVEKDIGVLVGGKARPVYLPSEFSTTIPELLDELYSTETPQQKKLKELEEQQRKIAAEMEQLRSEL